MSRLLYVIIALAGLGAAIANRRFAEASHDSSERFFGRRIERGSAESRFMGVWTRVLAVVVGLALFAMGVLATLGVIWTD